MRPLGLPHRRKHLFPLAWSLLLIGATTTAVFLLWMSSANVDTPDEPLMRSYAAADAVEDPEWSTDPPLTEPDDRSPRKEVDGDEPEMSELEAMAKETVEGRPTGASCATVEEMGEAFAAGSEMENLRIRDAIRRHFDLHGAARVRGLPPDQFCQESFVLGKASEAGFGNEMYKILTAAALSIMLNRSLIIGQTRGLYPFGDYVSYTNFSFTLKDVKHLWRKNDCAGKYGRSLQIRLDNFEHPTETNVLCSDWRNWKQPIIWFQGTTDAVAIQFFLKNVNPGMRNTASNLFGPAGSLKSRPNVFGELFRTVIDPSQTIKEAVNWVLNGTDPDIALHMRMLTNRSIRAVKAAIMCVKRALHLYSHQVAKPRIVLVSDTPSFIREITPNLTGLAEVIHFDYKLFENSISSWRMKTNDQSADFRVKDWGPAPRWVAFVDFFLASRAKHAVVSGAHRRVGTTYSQLIAALAAANHHVLNYWSVGIWVLIRCQFQRKKARGNSGDQQREREREIMEGDLLERTSAFPWWWESLMISPHSSHWFHSTLSELEQITKSLSSLAHQDPGDSLAQRAEFYYQKKPELLKIVEEVERLCRSLTLHCSQQSRRSSPPSTSQIAGGKTTKIESLRSNAEHSTAEDPDSELLAESKFEDSTISCEPTMQLLTSASCEHLKELARRNEEKRHAIAELWSQMELLMKQNVELMAENEALAARLQNEKQNHLPAACSRCSRINGRKHAISDQLARLKTMLVSAFWGEHSS